MVGKHGFPCRGACGTLAFVMPLVRQRQVRQDKETSKKDCLNAQVLPLGQAIKVIVGQNLHARRVGCLARWCVRVYGT